mmetsp:Transcript_91410/g.258851  ORF Transcript_91410/g.258851 Transcript_91410/m.258851 type:complete len:247 (-) Transcript_91410:165-905(-)|eukprot:CAMPEP_0168393628 /NCGR_PEP_ID=MMETSP0228-20121227/19116_1 /TAXON_ID=133427 /ORGANISM="Protoceratium reticulatum, Strain CCCM 535 (=CCMP 1889)" /LENGTH=246 /DNA_ID=CAMNT_0008407015 /DNA_START=83 /DNA_END=823 /DNA_ORIENTATION=+
MSKLTVAIIGATGNSGKWALKGALQRGWEVRVYARSAAKVESTLEQVFADGSDVKPDRERLRIVEGGLSDGAKLAELLTGADVVMSFLGMTKNSTGPVVRPGVESVMTAMRAIPTPPRFLSMSSISLGDSRQQANQAWGRLTTWLCLKVFLKKVFKDLQMSEDYIIANREGLKVTILRATVLGDKKGYFKDYRAKEPNYKLVRVGEKAKMGMYVDRQHVAEAFLDVCESGDFESAEVSIFDSGKKF